MSSNSTVMLERYHLTNLDIGCVISILILMILGFILNLVTLITFFKQGHYKRPSRLQLFSLAIDDFGTCLLVEPMVISMFFRGAAYEKDTRLCRLFTNFLHIFPWNSIVTLIMLSFTRMIVVLYPLAYRVWITQDRIIKTIVCKYFFAICFLAASNPHWTIVYSPQIQTCFVSYSKTNIDIPHKNGMPYVILGGTTVILILTGVILVQLFKMSLVKERFTQNRVKSLAVARELAMLVAVFLLTTIGIPFLAFRKYFKFTLSPEENIILAQIIKILFYVGPVINPAIYTYSRRRMLKGITQLVRRISKRGQRSTPSLKGRLASIQRNSRPTTRSTMKLRDHVDSGTVDLDNISGNTLFNAANNIVLSTFIFDFSDTLFVKRSVSEKPTQKGGTEPEMEEFIQSHSSVP